MATTTDLALIDTNVLVHSFGRDVFDLQLVATMLGNGVRRIYTFNAKDFEPFQELEVIVPTLP
jgi:hypothetical protein